MNRKRRPVSYINYEGALLTVHAQRGGCFDTFMGTIVCDPYNGTQYLLYPKTKREALFLDRLKRMAAQNDWHAYYATRNHALTLIPYWVWLKLWNGYSTIQSLPYARLKIDRDNRRLARR